MALKLCFAPHNVMILVRLVWLMSSVTQSEAKLHLFEVALNSGYRRLPKNGHKIFCPTIFAYNFFLVFPKTYWKVLLLPDFFFNFSQMVIFYHNTTLTTSRNVQTDS